MWFHAKKLKENPKKCVLWRLLIIVWTRGGEHQEQKVDEKGKVWQQSVSEEFDDPKIFENPKVIPNGRTDMDDPKIFDDPKYSR